MNAASKPAGLQVGSTRPLSRAERRAQAARVTAAETTVNETAPAAPEPQNTGTPPAPVVPSPGGEQ